jgi:prepilin-type N-terminal cleavage/methylation domain-containing protein
MKRPFQNHPSGLSLLEVMIAVAILAISLSVITGIFVQGGMYMAKQPKEFQAALLIRGAVLDVEDKYRIDGFPDNELEENLECETPSEVEEIGYSCKYDIEKLDFDVTELHEMAQSTLQWLQEQVGGQGNLLLAFQMLSFLYVQGEVPISPLCPATPSQFLSMCNISPERISANIISMVSFFPQVIMQAAERTRKLRVRIYHEDGKEPLIEVETFIVSVPKSAQLLQQEGLVQDPTATPLPTPSPGKPASKGASK